MSMSTEAYKILRELRREEELLFEHAPGVALRPEVANALGELEAAGFAQCSEVSDGTSVALVRRSRGAA